MGNIGPENIGNAPATLDGALQDFLRAAVALYAWDGALYSRLLTESAAFLNLRTAQFDGTNGPVSVRDGSSDGRPSTLLALFILAQDHDWNGASWDRHRGNLEATVLASAARTGDTNSADQTNYNAKGVMLHLNVSAVGAPAGSISAINVQAKDPVSGAYLTILAFSALAIATTGYRVFLIYPGAASAGAFTAAPLQSVLPRTWRINVDHANETDSITYSIAVTYEN